MKTLAVYRDDGPLADLLARATPPVPLASVVLTLLGVGGLGLGLAVDGGRTGLPTLLGVIAFAVLGLAARLGVPHARIEWLVPPTLRGAEYLVIIVLAWRAGAQTLIVAYGFLAALAFHHYDIVYRLRHQRIPPPDWLRRLGGGWELRMLLMSVASALGALYSAVVALLLWCSVLFVGESMVSWISVARDERRTVAAGIEEDDEFGDANAAVD